MPPSVAVGATVRRPLSRAMAARAARLVLVGEGARHATLSLAFVGARRMRSLNRDYFGKDRATDVIAFGFGSPGTPIIGDVYVCPEVAARNARRFGVSPRQELLRLIVHGVLHVLGHDHPAGDGRTESPMWRRQERYLRRLGSGRGGGARA